jgi:sialic acid synthase SpsE
MKKITIVAEAGSNWLGDLREGFALIDHAKACGASAVKFQVWDASSLYPADAEIRKNYDVEKCQMDVDTFARLKAHADKVGIPCFASAFSADDVRALADLGVPWMKVASRSAADWSILQACKDANVRPIISLSPQHRTLPSHGDYRKFFRPLDVKLLHCISRYPVDVREVSLSAFDWVDGFSDHTLSWVPAILAAHTAFKKGRSEFLVEKHFMIHRGAPDEICSLDGESFRGFVAALREVEAIWNP